MMMQIAKAPHMRKKRTTFSMMMELFVCLMILYAVSLTFYFLKGGPRFTNVQYGLYALQNLGIGLLFAVLPDLLWYLSIFVQMRADYFNVKIKEYFYKVIHSYSYITGLILVLLLPIGLEWYEIAISAFFATFVAKLVFGGFGSNIFNPAIVGRVFAQIVFPTHMTTYLGDIGPSLSNDVAYNITVGKHDVIFFYMAYGVDNAAKGLKPGIVKIIRGVGISCNVRRKYFNSSGSSGKIPVFTGTYVIHK